MKFSKRSEYGLKAVISLARTYPEVTSVKTLSDEVDAPFKYLEQLAGSLKKQGIIKSFPGKYGGYALARPPKSVSVGEVIEVLEGNLDPMNCSAGQCSHHKSCPSAPVWKKLGNEIKTTLYKIKLDKLIK